jgi:flagellin
MALSIANNVTSLNAQNSLSRTNNSLAKSLERLSTGLKVNRGADGPAALVISEQQRAQISGLRAAIDNTNKAIAVVQTGEGALNEINTLLTKLRSLMVDSANTGVNDTNALAANQAEIDNILTSIDRIANNTQFGSRKLLDGSSGVSGTATDADVTVLKATNETVAGAYAINVTTAAEKANVTAATGQTANLAANEMLTINGVQISLTAGMSQAQVIDRINEFSNQTGVKADNHGAAGATRLLSTAFGASASISVVSNVAAAANSSGFGNSVLNDTGVDIAGTINGVAATGAGNTLTATSGVAKGLSVSIALVNSTAIATVTGAQGNVNVTNSALSFQVGANAGQNVKLSFDKMNISALGIGASSVFTNLSQVTTANADEGLKVIDAAISDVSKFRGRLGAFQQNTLESNVNNLKATLENTVASESVIRDTDFAEEIANFTKFQTQIQAGTTVLGNANALTSLVANLLRG